MPRVTKCILEMPFCGADTNEATKWCAAVECGNDRIMAAFSSTGPIVFPLSTTAPSAATAASGGVGSCGVMSFSISNPPTGAMGDQLRVANKLRRAGVPMALGSRQTSDPAQLVKEEHGVASTTLPHKVFAMTLTMNATLVVASLTIGESLALIDADHRGAASLPHKLFRLPPGCQPLAVCCPTTSSQRVFVATHQRCAVLIVSLQRDASLQRHSSSVCDTTTAQVMRIVNPTLGHHPYSPLVRMVCVRIKTTDSDHDENYCVIGKGLYDTRIVVLHPHSHQYIVVSRVANPPAMSLSITTDDEWVVSTESGPESFELHPPTAGSGITITRDVMSKKSRCGACVGVASTAATVGEVQYTAALVDEHRVAVFRKHATEEGGLPWEHATDISLSNPSDDAGAISETVPGLPPKLILMSLTAAEGDLMCVTLTLEGTFTVVRFQPPATHQKPAARRRGRRPREEVIVSESTSSNDDE